MMNLKTDVMAKMTEEERQKIYNYCINNMILVYSDGSHWDIFMDNDKRCYSIAKPGCGAGNSHFGTIDYVKSLIEKNQFKREFLLV